MSSDHDFAAIRQDPDPLRRGRRATQLLTLYQQRSSELARVRRDAIDEAHHEGLSYSKIADAIGVTRARITQIRSTAPPTERALFGVGPVTLSVPLRYGTTDRRRPLIAAEDDQTRERMDTLLGALSLATVPAQITPDQDTPPEGDAVVICGPGSAPVGGALMSRDPALNMLRDDTGRWWIRHRSSPDHWGSPSDEEDPQLADVAYVARHQQADRVVLHIAGIHAIGSLGAAHYLSGHVEELFELGDRSWSLALRATHDQNLTIGQTDLIAGPYVW